MITFVTEATCFEIPFLQKSQLDSPVLVITGNIVLIMQFVNFLSADAVSSTNNHGSLVLIMCMYSISVSFVIICLEVLMKENETTIIF